MHPFPSPLTSNPLPTPMNSPKYLNYFSPSLLHSFVQILLISPQVKAVVFWAVDFFFQPTLTALLWCFQSQIWPDKMFAVVLQCLEVLKFLKCHMVPHRYSFLHPQMNTSNYPNVPWEHPASQGFGPFLFPVSKRRFPILQPHCSLGQPLVMFKCWVRGSSLWEPLLAATLSSLKAGKLHYWYHLTVLSS